MLYITNTKTITHPDGWGYKVSEGDECEVVITYFEERKEGNIDRETFRVCNGEAGRALLAAVAEQFDKMDAEAS